MVAPRCWPWCLIVQAANLRQERTKPSEGPCQKTRKSLAVAQTSDERAARLFPQNIAIRRAPLPHRFFDDGGEPARDAAEEVMAGIDQLVRGVLVGTRLGASTGEESNLSQNFRDAGADGARTMMLVYNLPRMEAIFDRFGGIAGSSLMLRCLRSSA
jgi:Envelope integrity protein A